MSVPHIEQYERVVRWYEKIKRYDDGVDHEIPSENYLDEFYAFFMNCYHLKDWVKADTSVNGEARTCVEDYVANTKVLSICGELCNSLKHLRHDRNSKENPKSGKKIFSLNIQVGEKTRIAVKFYIETNSGELDAFSFATACLEAWRTFFQDYALLPTLRISP